MSEEKITLKEFEKKSKEMWFNLKTGKWVDKDKVSSLADLHNYPASYEEWIDAGRPFPVDKLEDV